MKIAYFLADPGIGIFGVKGASVHAQEMIRAFRALGHDVTVYCLKRGTKAADPTTETVPEDLRNLPVFTGATAGSKGAAERELAVLRSASRLAALASEEDYDLIYERYSLFSDAGIQLAQQLRARTGRHVPVIMEVNSPLLDEQREHRSLHHDQLAQDLTRSALGGADLLSCVSSQVQTWCLGQLRPSSQTTQHPSVIITPNGVNTERFGADPLGSDPVSSDQLGGDRPFTVGFVGTLKPWHGTAQLLEAFACTTHPERRSWRLDMAGDGPQRSALEVLAAELGIRDQVRFRGAVDPALMPRVLAGFDIAAAPYPQSQNHYFSPLKVYEYMAAGLPIIASAIGEIPALLGAESHTGQDAGMVVPAGDVHALAAALEQLASDPQLRTRLGGHARHRAVEQHTWIRRAEDLVQSVRAHSAGLQEVSA